MALMLSSHPSTSNAKDLLETALTSFRAILTPEERQRLDQLCNSHPSQPDENSVMVLISEIDNQNSRKFSRYVGPKLQSFLDVVQQFSSIVDTFMAFGPTTARLVWSSVKVTMLVVSNFGEYFTKLAALFNSIGQTCPRLREFGKLYESSVGLQHALCRYFAGVIDICAKALKVSRRPGIIQFSMAAFKPFESEFGESRDKLIENAGLIKEEVSLALSTVQVQEAKLDQLERKYNSDFRKSMTRFSSLASQELADLRQFELQAVKRRLVQNRQKTKDNLCLLDPKRAWKQARKQCLTATATWFRQNAEFDRWLATKNSSTIWYSGKMGSGKTILTSSIITYLTLLNDSSHIVSYFFCQNEVPETLLSRNIVGSFARQMLDSFIESATGTELERLLVESFNLDTEEKAEFVSTRYRSPSTCFILVDGLDHCELSEIGGVLRALKHLMDHVSSQVCLKLFISSRPEISRNLNSILKPDFRLTPSLQDLDDDMSTYIEAALDKKMESSQLLLNNEELITTVQNVLLVGAQGMFLWAYLLIEDLCLRNSDREILESLGSIPTELSVIFDRLLKHALLDESNCETSIQLLKWTVGTVRALTEEELREALTIRPGQTFLDSQSLRNDLSAAVFNCRGLVFVDEDDSTIHLIHHSFKQYLLSEGKDGRLARCHFERLSLENELAMLCMTYLGFNDFRSQLSKLRTESTKLVAPDKIAGKVMGLSTAKMEKMAKARSLLRSSRREPSRKDQDEVMEMVRKELEKASVKAAGSGSRSAWKERGLQFIEYARYSWIHHTKWLDPETTPDAWVVFCRLINHDLLKPDETKLAETPWAAAEWFSRSRKISQWICDHDHLAVVKFILRESNRAFPEAELRYLLMKAVEKGNLPFVDILVPTCERIPIFLITALETAAGCGHVNVVERLLAAKADVNAPAAGYEGRTALQAAAGGGHLEVVERLIAAKADVNAAAADGGGRTALQAAAGGGHLEVVERLIAAKADVNAAAAAGYDGRTALQAAAGGGHLEVVERLIAAKADVNAAAAAGYDGRTALQAAAGGGHLEVVERLIAAKADVNAAAAAGYDGRTALQAAAGGGHLEVVERLLAAKADVDAAADGGGRTALQAAAGGGHLEVVERLIAAKADVNAAPAAGYDGRTALQAAAGGGHLEVVERLIAAKADVNAAAADGRGRTALQAAAGGGHLEVVERLLAAKADVNAAAADGGGRTALQAAAGGGHLEVVERLLAAKADVDAAAAGYEGRTALQAAAGGGHLEVVERLIAAKADVNAAPAAGYDGRTALQAAAGGGHLEVVERLIAAKADVNAAAADGRGRTALQAAAGGGHLEVVERLLAAKADVNAAAAGGGGRTALQAAAGGGHLEVVERLLAAKADVNAAPAAGYDGRTALQAAAGGGHLEVVERLIAAKADVNAAPAAGDGGRTALQAAAGGGHLEVVERLIAAKADVNAAPAAGYDGRTALQAAAGGGHLEVVERLIAAKADVNAAAAAGYEGRTALQAAAGGGHLEVVERLIAAKADVNAAAAAGYDGRTALQAAAGGGHLEVVERLIAAKADVNAAAADGGGRTALQAAAGGGHLEVVERLLAAKADVDAAAAGYEGRTALQAAAGGGHLEVVERLLAAKADVNAAAGAGYRGRRALQAAAGGGHLEVVERLKKQVQDQDS